MTFDRTDLRRRLDAVPVAPAPPRRLRRLQVSALYGGYALLGAGFLWRPYGIALVVIGVVSVFFAFLMLFRRTATNAPQIGDGALDERERSARDRAIRFGFFAYTLIASLAAAAGTLLWTFGDPARIVGPLVYLLWGVMLMGTTLPTAILAWTQPDPDHE